SAGPDNGGRTRCGTGSAGRAPPGRAPAGRVASGTVPAGPTPPGAGSGGPPLGSPTTPGAEQPESAPAHLLSAPDPYGSIGLRSKGRGDGDGGGRHGRRAEQLAIRGRPSSSVSHRRCGRVQHLPRGTRARGL